MGGFWKFLLLSLLAIASGIAAVSIPIEGKTVAEHVRGLLEGAAAKPSAAAKPAPPRMARRRPSEPAPDRPPADDPSEEDRAALERLIGERVR